MLPVVNLCFLFSYLIFFYIPLFCVSLPFLLSLKLIFPPNLSLSIFLSFSHNLSYCPHSPSVSLSFSLSVCISLDHSLSLSLSLFLFLYIFISQPLALLFCFFFFQLLSLFQSVSQTTEQRTAAMSAMLDTETKTLQAIQR